MLSRPASERSKVDLPQPGRTDERHEAASAISRLMFFSGMEGAIMLVDAAELDVRLVI